MDVDHPRHYRWHSCSRLDDTHVRPGIIESITQAGCHEHVTHELDECTHINQE